MSYLINCIDEYSKWPEIGSLRRSPTSADVIEFLRPLFNRFGVPEIVKTDGATIFGSKQFQAFLDEKGSQHYTTTPYNSRSNAHIERFNGTVLDTIRMFPAHEAWSEVERKLMMYRATEHTTTGVSPYKRMFGREMRTTLAASVQRPTKPPDEPDQPSNKEFKVGDRVMLKRVGHVTKGEPWWQGPFPIEQVLPHGSYRIAGKIVSHRRIRMCTSAADRGPTAVEAGDWDDPGSVSDSEHPEPDPVHVHNPPPVQPWVVPPVPIHVQGEGRPRRRTNRPHRYR